jgi:hypothetical protein
LIDVNHADEDELSAVLGVGKKTAIAIVQRRTDRRFKTAADLEAVPGGTRTRSSIAPRLLFDLLAEDRRNQAIPSAAWREVRSIKNFLGRELCKSQSADDNREPIAACIAGSVSPRTMPRQPGGPPHLRRASPLSKSASALALYATRRRGADDQSGVIVLDADTIIVSSSAFPGLAASNRPVLRSRA